MTIVVVCCFTARDQLHTSAARRVSQYSPARVGVVTRSVRPRFSNVCVKGPAMSIISRTLLVGCDVSVKSLLCNVTATGVDELSLAVDLSADSDDVSDHDVIVPMKRSRDSAGGRGVLPSNNIQLVLTSADDESDDGESYLRVAVICIHNLLSTLAALTSVLCHLILFNFICTKLNKPRGIWTWNASISVKGQPQDLYKTNEKFLGIAHPSNALS